MVVVGVDDIRYLLKGVKCILKIKTEIQEVHPFSLGFYIIYKFYLE